MHYDKFILGLDQEVEGTEGLITYEILLEVEWHSFLQISYYLQKARIESQLKILFFTNYIFFFSVEFCVMLIQKIWSV